MNKIKEIIEKIKEYNTIIIHRHRMPDGDAYGSSLGLKYAIKLNFPNKEVYAVGNEPFEELKRFGRTDNISDDKYKDALVIVTDTPTEPRIDDKRFNTGKYLIKIDHHPDDVQFGDLQWIDPSYTSATEMVGDLIQQAKWKINKEIGEVIFHGIVTDSLRFSINTVSPRTLSIASYYLSTGFNLTKMYELLYNKDISRYRAEGELLDNAHIEKGVGWIVVTKEFLKKWNIPYKENTTFSNLLKYVKGADIWVTFAANENGTWRVQIRSDEYVVNKVAEKYGGGGHQFAPWTIVDSLDKLEPIIKDYQSLIKK